MFLINFTDSYCSKSEQLIIFDNLVTTSILSIFFFIGSCSNLFLVAVHFQKAKKKGFWLSSSNRVKNQVNNKAIFWLTAANLILSVIFIPYTILFRVWQIKISTVVIKIMEHLKDSLIYMNLFFISVLSVERYFAVCKPQYYKTLESNINKIIWVVYLFLFFFSSSNYLTDIKLELHCAINIGSDINNKFSIKKLMNYINVILSTFFFIATAIISSSFYFKISLHQQKFSENRKLKTIIKIKKDKNETILENLIINNPTEFNSCKSFKNNQSSVSVQTDFEITIDKEIMKNNFLRQRSSSTKVLTKISILVRYTKFK